MLKPKLEIDFKGWKVEGDIWHWHFQVKDQADRLVARVDQEIWHITDHYVIEAVRDEDILDVLMLALAMSAAIENNIFFIVVCLIEGDTYLINFPLTSY